MLNLTESKLKLSGNFFLFFSESELSTCSYMLLISVLGLITFFVVSLIFFLYQFQDNNTNGEETSDASFQPLEESHPVEVTPNSQKRAAFSET